MLDLGPNKADANNPHYVSDENLIRFVQIFCQKKAQRRKSYVNKIIKLAGAAESSYSLYLFRAALMKVLR